MGWRAERRERREERERRRTVRRAEGHLTAKLHLIGLGIFAAMRVVFAGASTSLSAWIIGIGAAIAAIPTVIGIRQLPDAYRQLRRAKK